MNMIEEILGEAKASNVTLYIKEGQLAFIAEQGSFPSDLKAKIGKYKIDIISALAMQEVSVETDMVAFALLSDDERGSLGEGYEDAYPMSALQAGMVFHTQLEGFSGIYHDIMGEHVKCPWNRSCFEAALAACIEQHPILRTGFRLEGERPLQMVHAAIELPLKVEDLRGQLAAEQEQYLVGWMQERKLHVFDWEQGPLLHIDIFLRTEESFQYVISFHHAVLDGWSRAVLTTMLYNRYERLLRGQEVEAVQVDWTYRDFIAQEQQVLSDPAAKAYFGKMLEDAPTQQLPRVKGVSGARRGQVRSHEILAIEAFTPLSGRVIELALQLGVPVQSVLMAGHFKVLATMSGQSRAVSCVTHNGRPEAAGAERSLGLYLNSLPQALEVSRGSWRSLIRQVAEMNAASMQYRGYPLSKIQQDVGRTFSEVLFNYTHFHIYTSITKNADQDVKSLGSAVFEQTNFDLLVDVSRGMDDDMMSLTMVYDGQAFDEGMIARLGQYYVKAFELMLAGLDEPHHAQSLLSDGEVRQLLVEWNATATKYPRDTCLHQLFEAQVERSPEAVALVFDEQQLSYRELNERANQLAHYLRAQGVRPDTLVGLCIERSLEMVVGILGILKAGAGYVPLEPTYPQERLDYMIADSAPALVLTQGSLQGRLAGTAVPRLLLDEEREMVSAYPTSNPRAAEVGVRSKHLAYVIYTSGSTGKPKGVMVEHRHVQRLLASTEADFRFGPQDVWTLFHSYAFDFSVWELWGALTYGGKLVVIPNWVARSPEDFYQLLRRHQVTVLNQTPTAFTQLAHVDEDKQEALALRVVVFGGEALNLSELKGWVARHGDEAPVLVNMYGITETTVHVTYRRIWQEDITGELGSVIGRPLADLRVYLLDTHQGLVPVGTVGEMYVGGRGVARGYLNQAELTAERFIANPYVAGERLYKTGDLARYLAGGELEYLGRADDQVKIRGYRIELGEIEQQLGAMAGVSAAVVLAREDESGRKRLVAYVMPSEYPVEVEQQAALRPSLISGYREGLAASLPDYMVPSAFVILAEMPLTPNGKLDRKALPSPEGEDVQAAVYVAPRNATEQAMCEVWQEVLGLDRIGIEDNFFSLGGDSILSIRIVSMLKGRGVSVEIKDIFQHQTIEQLAAPARQGGLEQETFIDTKQIAQLLINERDELDENLSETIL